MLTIHIFLCVASATHLAEYYPQRLRLSRAIIPAVYETVALPLSYAGVRPSVYPGSKNRTRVKLSRWVYILAIARVFNIDRADINILPRNHSLPSKTDLLSVALPLSYEVKSLDWHAQSAELFRVLPDGAIAKVLQKLMALLLP